jgi:hypothetical protein
VSFAKFNTVRRDWLHRCRETDRIDAWWEIIFVFVRALAVAFTSGSN